MPLQVINKPNNELGELSQGLSIASQIYALYQKVQGDKHKKQAVARSVGALSLPVMQEEEPEEEIKALEAPPEVLAPAGLEQFSKDLAAKLEQKRAMTGGKDIAAGETGVDQTDMSTVFNAISELPLTGDIPFAEVTDMIFKNFEKSWNPTAQSMINQVLGDALGELTKDPKQTMKEDTALTKQVKDVFFPDEEKEFDEKGLLASNPELELKTVSTTGTRTYGKKGESKDFQDWEEAQRWTESHPQEGFEWKIDRKGEGFDVVAVKKTKEPDDKAKKITPTYQTIVGISEDLMNPGMDYEDTMHNAQVKYNLDGVKLPSPADQAERAHGMFEGILFDEDNEYISEEGFVNDEEAYADYYKDYEKYAEKYYKETGQILPKKFLSLEEAGKFTKNTWGTGKKGESRPVLNEEEIPWEWQKDLDTTEEFYKEMTRSGLSPEDYDLDKLVKDKGLDRERLKKLVNK